MAECLIFGQAGVHAIASQLLLRGHHLYFPAVDDRGVDIMTSDGVRIQVKSSRMYFRKPYPYGGYQWNLKATTIKNGRTGIRLRVMSDECDFLALWGADQNRFWIIPAAVVPPQSMSIQFTASETPQFRSVDMELVEKLRTKGMPLADIAKEMSVPLTTLWRRYTSGKNVPDEKWNPSHSRYAKYEDAWELLSEHIALKKIEATTFSGTAAAGVEETAETESEE